MVAFACVCVVAVAVNGMTLAAVCMKEIRAAVCMKETRAAVCMKEIRG